MSAHQDLRSRRALLGAGLGAVAATVAGALGRPRVALATSNPVEIDTPNVATSTTSIDTASGHGFQASTDDATGAGLFGLGTNGGYGVFGRASGSNPAVIADSQGSGPALRANGRLQLSTSGVAVIAAGHTSVTVTPILPVIDVNTGSFVLLTPNSNIAPRALWYTKNITANSITIRMSSSRTKATKVSWLLLG